MKNAPDIKLGLVVGSTDWLPLEVAVACGRKLAEAYKTVHTETEIYECPICITDNEVSVKRALRDLNKAECDAICLYYANYGPESAGALLVKDFNGPAMLFAAAEEGDVPLWRNRKDAMSGFANACYAFNLLGTDAFVPPNPVGTIEQCVKMIHEFIPIARAMTAVRNLKIISFGPRPSSYLAACAPNHLLYDIGVELSEYSELELLDSFHKHDADKRILPVAAEMAEELGNAGNKTPEILPRLAQYELTVEDWIRTHRGNRKYVALTSTCWPAFPTAFGFVPCYVNSRITGKGIPVACEVDVYGAISEYISQCISDECVTILNINNNVPPAVYDQQVRGRKFNGKTYSIEDLFIGYHCGVTCSHKMISCSMEHHFVNNQLIGEEQSKGTLQGQIIPGPITMFRLQGSRDGKLRAYIAQGQILPISLDTYGGYGVIAIPEMGRLFQNVLLKKHFPNHTAILFGHYGKALFSLMGQLGIDEVDYNHPANIPYPNENQFASQSDWF